MSTDPQFASIILYMVLAFQIFLSIAGAIYAIARYHRRIPPLDRELGEFMRRPECEKRHALLSETYNRIIAELAGRLQRGDTLFRQIERALGRIEGKIEELQRRGQ